MKKFTLNNLLILDFLFYKGKIFYPQLKTIDGSHCPSSLFAFILRIIVLVDLSNQIVENVQAFKSRFTLDSIFYEKGMYNNMYMYNDPSITIFIVDIFKCVTMSYLI